MINIIDNVIEIKRVIDIFYSPSFSEINKPTASTIMATTKINSFVCIEDLAKKSDAYAAAMVIIKTSPHLFVTNSLLEIVQKSFLATKKV